MQSKDMKSMMSSKFGYSPADIFSPDKFSRNKILGQKKKYQKYIKKSVRRLICILRCAKEFNVKFNYKLLDLSSFAHNI